MRGNFLHVFCAYGSRVVKAWCVQVTRGLAYVGLAGIRDGLFVRNVVWGVRVYVCDGVNKECRKRGALITDTGVGSVLRRRKFTLELERDMSEERVSVRALVVQSDNRRWESGIKMCACMERECVGMTVGVMEWR